MGGSRKEITNNQKGLKLPNLTPDTPPLPATPLSLTRQAVTARLFHGSQTLPRLSQGTRTALPQNLLTPSSEPNRLFSYFLR